MCTQTRLGAPRSVKEVRLHLSAPFGFTFHLFPSTHFLFLLLFISFLSSCLVTSFLSFFFAHLGPALCAHLHSYTKPRSEVAQVVITRHGFSGCSFSPQPHTLSCLVFLSSLHLLSSARAHLHLSPGPSSRFLAPLSGARVCVCETLGSQREPIGFFSRGHRLIMDTCANKLFHDGRSRLITSVYLLKFVAFGNYVLL